MENNTSSNYSEFYPDYPDVISVIQMSHILGICKVKAYELVKSGQIPAKKIGRQHRIMKQAVFTYLKDGNYTFSK